MHADSRTPTTWAHAGITLIELMVVLAIVAGIAAISFSAFGSLTNATLRAEAMPIRTLRTSPKPPQWHWAAPCPPGKTIFQ